MSPKQLSGRFDDASGTCAGRFPQLSFEVKKNITDGGGGGVKQGRVTPSPIRS